MKKIIFAALVAIASVVSVSSVVAANRSNANSSAVETIPFYEEVLQLTDSKATIEYKIPNIISGTMDLKHFERIYRLLPNEIRKQAMAAYYEVSSKNQSQFTYAGVRVKHNLNDNTWEFHYRGASIIVRDATPDELYKLFGEIG